jgi:hypothetical protein
MKRALLFPLIALLLVTGCFTRSVTQPVYEHDLTQVNLRSQKQWTKTVPKDYQHPLAISSARLAHILSRMDMRNDAGDAERMPAIPLDLLYAIAEGMAKAFAEADPDQEVVVMAIDRSKHWGLFDRRHLTSFVAYQRDNLIYIFVSRVNWEIPNTYKTDLPQPYVDEQQMPFRLAASEGMTLVGPQAVAVVWRDPVFKRPTRTRILPSGKVVRREVLMESPEQEPAAPISTDVLPANLAPDTLRRLADLEEQKARGEVTQTQYNVLREDILQSDPSVGQ